MASEFAEVPFSLVEVILAAYNSGVYDVPISLDKDQIVEVDPQADNDELRDSGAVVDFLSVVTHGLIKIGFGGIDHDALAILSGTSTSTSGTTPNQVRTHDWKAGADGLPYFGFIGVGRATNGARIAVGCPKAILDTFPKWMLDGKESKFIINDIAGKAAAESTLVNLIVRVRSYETAADYTTPADAAAFLAFFNANPAPS